MSHTARFMESHKGKEPPRTGSAAKRLDGWVPFDEQNAKGARSHGATTQMMGAHVVRVQAGSEEGC